MASTNEDAVVLASSRQDERLLIMRHLPDRATVELAWWRRDDLGTTEQLQTLEIPAEAAEVSALARLCKAALEASWETLGDGEVIAVAGSPAESAELAALRAGDEVLLVWRPERDDLIRLSRPALQLLAAEMLPAAMRKLETLGFGMPQNGDR